MAALLWSVQPSAASAQITHVIEAGHEAEIQALFAPHRLGDELAGGFVFQTIAIAQDEIRIAVRRGAQDSFATLRHESVPGERIGSFAATLDTDDAEARVALEQLLSAVGQHPNPAIWHTLEHRSPPTAEQPAGPDRRPAFWIAHVLYLLATLFAVAVWIGRSRRRGWLVGVVSVAIAAWTAAFFLATSPQDIPIRELSGLQEGTTLMVLRLLEGRGVHGGANLEFLGTLWAHASSPFRTRVWIDLWLTYVDVALFAGIAHAWLGKLRFSVPAVTLYATAPTTMLAAHSESPASFLALYFFAGVILAAALRQTSSAWTRRLLTLGLLPGIYLLAQTRVEWLAIGLTSLAVALAYEPPIRERLDHRIDALLRHVKRLAGRPRAWQALVVFLFIWPMLLHQLPLGPNVGALLAPLHGHIWSFPYSMARMAGIGPSLLMVGGLAYGTIRWRESLLLPLPVGVMFVVYVQMGHEGEALAEMDRYLCMLMPACFVLMLLGWRGLEQLAARWQWAPWWPWVAALLWILSTHATLPAKRHPLPAEGVQQVELRYLARALEAHPDCAFLAPVTKAETVGGDDDLEELHWALFGRGREVRTAPMDGSSARETLRRMAPDAACGLVYHSATCSLVGAGACPPLGPAEARLEVLSSRNRRYYVHVDYHDPVELFLVRTQDAPPP